MEPSEYRAVIKYLMKKQLNTKQIHEELVSTYHDASPSYSTVKRWCHEFKLGRESCMDAPRAGRPCTVTNEETVNEIHDIVMADRRVTIRKIVEETKASYGTVQSILVDVLHMKKLSSRWVPRMLSIDQKRQRVVCAQELLARIKRNPEKFYKQFATMDETWVHHFDPETKRQSMEWKHHGSPCTRKFRVVPSAGR